MSRHDLVAHEEDVDTDMDSDTDMDFDKKQDMKILHVILGSFMLAALAIGNSKMVSGALGDFDFHVPWWWEYLLMSSTIMEWLSVVLLVLTFCLTLCMIYNCGEKCLEPIIECVFPNASFLGPYLCLFWLSGVCCAIIFWATLYVFPYACTYYASTGVEAIFFQGGNVMSSNASDAFASSSTNITMMNFTHINCPSSARPTVTLFGHFGVIAVLWVLYGVSVIKPDFGREYAPELAFDFLDFQDFALLLVDDEVLKSAWGVAEDGHGSSWLWKALMVVTLSAFISIMVQFFVAYHCSNTSDEKEDNRFNCCDCLMRVLSLVLIEIPFAGFRVYTSYAFGIPSSPMLIKNVVSIAKEVSEIACWTKAPLSALEATLGGVN